MFHNKNPKSFVFNFWGSLQGEGGFFCCNFGHLPFCVLFSVGLGSPPAFPFEAKSQLASSPARSYVRVLQTIRNIERFLAARDLLPLSDY